MVLQVQHVAFVDRVQSLVKNVADVFEKRKDRSKCPRCKGTGLLNNSKSWFWEQKAASTEHCWFCEGIGSMPIVGVNGYMVARASPVIHTRDHKTSCRSSLKAHLYLGKYPGARCNFKTLKPSADPTDLLHEPWRLPDWLSGELMRGKKQRPAATMVRPPPMFTTGKVRRPPRGLSLPAPAKGSQLQPDRLPRLPTTRRPGTMPSSRAQLPPSEASIPPSTQVPRSRMRDPPKLSSIEDENAFILPGPPFMRAISNSKEAMSLKDGEFSDDVRTSMINTIRAGLTSRVYGPEMSTRPLLKSPGSSRKPRRERNRIREKEKRKAVIRAKKVLEPLGTIGPAAGTPSRADIEPADTTCGNVSSGWLFGGRSPSSWFGSKLPWLGPQACKQLPWLPPFKGLSSSEYSRVNHVVCGSFMAHRTTNLRLTHKV